MEQVQADLPWLRKSGGSSRSAIRSHKGLGLLASWGVLCVCIVSEAVPFALCRQPEVARERSRSALDQTGDALSAELRWHAAQSPNHIRKSESKTSKAQLATQGRDIGVNPVGTADKGDASFTKQSPEAFQERGSVTRSSG
jgi:hypothetical protein